MPRVSKKTEGRDFTVHPAKADDGGQCSGWNPIKCISRKPNCMWNHEASGSPGHRKWRRECLSYFGKKTCPHKRGGCYHKKLPRGRRSRQNGRLEDSGFSSSSFNLQSFSPSDRILSFASSRAGGCSVLRPKILMVSFDLNCLLSDSPAYVTLSDYGSMWENDNNDEDEKVNNAALCFNSKSW